MSPQSDTLSWFRDNQSLLFLLNIKYRLNVMEQYEIIEITHLSNTYVCCVYHAMSKGKVNCQIIIKKKKKQAWLLCFDGVLCNEIKKHIWSDNPWITPKDDIGSIWKQLHYNWIKYRSVNINFDSSPDIHHPLFFLISLRLPPPFFSFFSPHHGHLFLKQLILINHCILNFKVTENMSCIFVRVAW